MGRTSAATKQKAKGEFDYLIVPLDEIQRHMQSAFEPIAQRAYEIFESRGRVHGHDSEDWYQAQSELLQTVKVELSDSGDFLVAVADVSGYRHDDLRVNADGQFVRICGCSSAQSDQSGDSEEKLQRLEAFFLSFDLPAPIDTSQVYADIRNDLLEVYLPKAIPHPDA